MISTSPKYMHYNLLCLIQWRWGFALGWYEEPPLASGTNPKPELEFHGYPIDATLCEKSGLGVRVFRPKMQVGCVNRIAM